MAAKASIRVLEGDGPKGKIEVMFNPSEYTVSRVVQEAGKGANSQFKVVENSDLTLSLFFDTYEEGADVREKTKQIVALTEPAIGNLERKRPPICLFEWGGFSYPCRVSKVNQKFTMFRQDGVPVRAELTVTLKYYVNPKEEEKNQGKDNCRKFWIVKSGERLDLIAYRTLEDPGRWPQIARLNRIRDPLTFPRQPDIGRLLIIPDYKELD